MENNKNALKSYVAVFAGIGTEYGEALLSGIQSTSSRILAYLNSLASAVRSATEGGTPTFSGYETCTNSVLSGLAVVGESGKPEIVDFSGGEQVIAFNESVAMMGRAASEAMAYSQAVENIVTSLASEGSYGQAGYMSRAEEPYGMAGERGGGLVYSPTYISPVEASIDELMMKDQIMMRRLGLSY